MIRPAEWLALPDEKHFMCRVGNEQGLYVHMTVPRDMYVHEKLRAAVEADLKAALQAKERGDA